MMKQFASMIIEKHRREQTHKIILANRQKIIKKLKDKILADLEEQAKKKYSSKQNPWRRHSTYWDELNNSKNHLTNFKAKALIFDKSGKVVYACSAKSLRKYTTDDLSTYKQEVLLDQYVEEAELVVDNRNNVWLLTDMELCCREGSDLSNLLFSTKSRFFCPRSEYNLSSMTLSKGHLYLLLSNNSLMVVCTRSLCVLKIIENASNFKSEKKQISAFLPPDEDSEDSETQLCISSYSGKKFFVEILSNLDLNKPTEINLDLLNFGSDCQRSISRRTISFAHHEFGEITGSAFSTDFEYLYLISSKWILACRTSDFVPVSSFKRLVGSKRDDNGELLVPGNRTRFLAALPDNCVVQFATNHYQILQHDPSRNIFRSLSKDTCLKGLYPSKGGAGLIFSASGNQALIYGCYGTGDVKKNLYREFGDFQSSDFS